MTRAVSALLRARTPVIPTAILVGTLAACSSSGDSAAAVRVRDSSAVRIVENAAPAWRDGESWHLAEAPSVEIGVTEGESPYQLYRVLDATRLTDGRIVLANTGSFELRLFDTDGHFLASAGREGDGPGEFRILYMLRRGPGDTVFAFDFVPQRITVYDSNLHLVETRIPRRTERVPTASLIGRFNSGSFVGLRASSDAAPESRFHYSPAIYLHYSPSGDLLDTIAAGPGWDLYRVEYMALGGMVRVSQTPPFGRVAQYTVSADQILVGNGETYEIQVFGEDGGLRMLIRRTKEPVAVTAEHLEQYRAAQLAPLGSSRFRPAWERAFADMPVASTLPAFDSLLTDVEGDLWAREYQIQAEGPRRWDVFDSTGRWLGSTATPSRFHVFEVGSDYVLGLWKDDLGVERVQLYALIKP